MKYYTISRSVAFDLRIVQRLFRDVSAVLVAIVLSGCSTPVLIKQPQQQPVTSYPYEQRQDALGTLLNQAWLARKEGRLDEAESALGRAMRIRPTAPEVYYQLALLRQDQRRFEQSRQLAERALSLGPNGMLEREINHLLRSLSNSRDRHTRSREFVI